MKLCVCIRATEGSMEVCTFMLPFFQSFPSPSLLFMLLELLRDALLSSR